MNLRLSLDCQSATLEHVCSYGFPPLCKGFGSEEERKRWGRSALWLLDFAKGMDMIDGEVLIFLPSLPLLTKDGTIMKS